MIYKFFKYQGTGNDFIIFDGINNDYPRLSTEEIAKLCDRKFGIGADGLMILVPEKGVDFTMVYYNSDGKESSMCGNGGRCIAHLASLRQVSSSHAIFNAIDGLHHALIKDNLVKLQMKNDIAVAQNEVKDYVINTGSPHYIHFSNKADLNDVVAYGKSIRYNDTYQKEGINVNLVSYENGIVEIATYERGVEDETLSCGTGVTAAALAVHEKYNLPSPISIVTKGGILKVYFKKTEHHFQEVYLEGPATLVFEGDINL